MNQNQKNRVLLEKKRERRKIFLLGCGRWGSFLAWYLNEIGHSVCLYGRENSSHLQQLRNTRRNEYIALPKEIALSSRLEEAKNAEVIIISIAAQALAGVAQNLACLGLSGKTIVLCMKGLEAATGKRLSQIASAALGGKNEIAVWLGPGHVQEFYRGVPNCMVIDSQSPQTKSELIDAFSSPLIRFYYGSDLIGNEIGAAAKNVMGIAAGILEGMDRASLKGALMARGTREIARLIAALGGNELSAYGLCHLGDYEATLFSPHSHNLNFGKCIAQGKAYEKLAEGAPTVKALCKLGEEQGVDLPICNAVHQILYEKANPETILEMLFRRTLRSEFGGDAQ